MNLLYVAKLTDSKLKEKLTPLLYSSHVSHLYVLRDYPGIAFDDRVTYLCPRKPVKGFIRHILKVFKGIYYCRKYNIDAVIGVLITPHGYIGRIISVFAHLPYIHVTISGHREFWRDGKIEECFNYWLLRKALFIMVTGSQTKQYLLNKNFDSKKITILPNIPDNYFLNIHNVISSHKREYDILFMSRIDKNKNLGLLLRAVSVIKTEKDMKVLIVGDGEELQKMIALSKSLKIDDRLVFSGYVSNIKEKEDVCQSAKIFVSCSKGEGFPVSLLEAMSCGCVPVVSNVGDIIDAIEQGENGFCYNDTDNEKEIVGYLGYLLKNENRIKEMSEKAQQISQRVSVEKNAEIWDSVLSKLYDRK